MKTQPALLLLSVLALPVWGQSVYKCQQPNGIVLYTQHPCEGQPTTPLVEPTPPAIDPLAAGMRVGEWQLWSERISAKPLEEQLPEWRAFSTLIQAQIDRQNDLLQKRQMEVMRQQIEATIKRLEPLANRPKYQSL